MINYSNDTLLIIADISGYTNFMLSNKNSLAKSSRVISELLLSVIEHLELHLSIAKIEGDAIFLYAKKENDKDWEKLHESLGEKLVGFFTAFRKKVNDLKHSVLCEGGVCNAIDSLAVKIIVHIGTAEEVEIGEFKELAGIDVIIVHRLLKNSIPADEYILLTESACKEMKFPEIICLEVGRDYYDKIGDIDYYVYFPTKQKRFTLFH